MATTSDSAGRSGSGRTQTACAGNQDLATHSSSSVGNCANRGNGLGDSAGRSGSGLNQTACAGNQGLATHSPSSAGNRCNSSGDSAGRSGSERTQTACAGNLDLITHSPSSVGNQGTGSSDSAGRSGSVHTQTACAGNQDLTSHSLSNVGSRCNGSGDSAGRSGSGHAPTACAGNQDPTIHIIGNKETSDKSDLIREAEEYVNSVMSGNSMITLRTPLVSKKRGRRLSMPDESAIKRARNISSESSDFDSARRKLDMNSEDLTESQVIHIVSPDNGGPPKVKETSNGRRLKKAKKKNRKASGNNSECIVTRADVHVNSDLEDMDAKQMLLKMYNDMNLKFSALHSSVQEMEANIEKKVTANVKKALDKRISEETSKMKKDLNQKIDGARADFSKEVIELSKRLDKIETKSSKNVDKTDPVKNDIRKNLVIRQLPETVNERLSDKVEALLKDGCKISDIQIEKVERKQSRNESMPGVVIVTVASVTDKQRIMDAKSRLKDSRRYSDVYINNDQTREERLVSANFRSMIRAYKVGNKDINFKGRRVVNSDNVSNLNSAKSDFNRASPDPYNAMSRNESSRNSRSRPNHQRYEDNTYSGKVKYSGGKGYSKYDQGWDYSRSNYEWNKHGERTNRDQRNFRDNRDFYSRHGERDDYNRREECRHDDRPQSNHDGSYSRRSATRGYGPC